VNVMRALLIVLCAGLLVGCGTTASAPQQLLGPTATGAPSAAPGGMSLPRTPVASAAAPRPSLRGSAPPATNGATVGSRITIGEVAVTLHGVQDNAPVGSIAAKAGTRCYAVEITIANPSAQPAPYSALFGTLRAADNAEYLPVISDQPAPALSGGLLDPGAAIRGWLAYDLPGGGKAAQLTYEHLGASGTFTLP
jgi:hypothetical protein